MQSETQKVREDKPAEKPAQTVRQQAAIDEPNEVAHDHKTFRVAVVIGLAMVGLLSLFLPGKKDGSADYSMVMMPAPVEIPDVAQQASTDSELPQTGPVYTEIDSKLETLTDQIHLGFETLQTDKVDLKHALSTLVARFDEFQAALVEHHQSHESLRSRQADTHTQLETLAQTVQSFKVVKQQATPKKSQRIVGTPPFQIVAIDLWDDLAYVAVSQKGQVTFLKTGEQQSGWIVTHIDRLQGQVGFRGPAGQAYTVSLQR